MKEDKTVYIITETDDELTLRKGVFETKEEADTAFEFIGNKGGLAIHERILGVIIH